jgi:type VI secretion system protein ImpA
MSAERVLDIDVLLATPAPDESSNGEDVAERIAEERRQLANRFRATRDQLKRDRNPPEDPYDDTPVKVDWAKLVQIATDALREPYKDLQIAAYLTDALTVREGFPGARDGLHLLRRLIDECWESLSPPVDDGDFEVYAAPFAWLNGEDTGSRFPNRLRATTLFRGPKSNLDYSFHDWNQAKDGIGRISWADFEKAVDGTSLADCEAVASDLAACRDELRLLTESIANRPFGADGNTNAVSLENLGKALKDCYGLVQQTIRKKGGQADASGAGETVPDDSGHASGPSTAATRDTIYRQLKQAADSLRRLEPHSPVPYLIHRAVELGALPFHQMIRALIRDVAVLGELNRELGIKEDNQPTHAEE